MYDKSIPLIYTQEIENNEETNNDVWQIGKYCENKNSNYCKITQQILILLKNVNENIEKNSFDMSDRLIKRFNDNKRSKRGIQLLEFVKEEKDKDMQERNNHQNSIQDVQEIIFSIITKMSKFTNYEKESSNHLNCKLHKIPTRIIKPNTLQIYLIKLSDVL
ncbi:hypothetical protein QTP88_011451 [Uroleucon formosanum]